ncbi:urea transporter [Nitzschia inconspicua]|uniref:Urea transporter n=1 Tax=Nitzschia inconspicua TaxID=303405 RepID=A0A9K3LSG6_9STRA|nr:urea transporter [Nitzschia inconspicua]KAG7366171.1 urea transporter [Nitzschia inconspicua]
MLRRISWKAPIKDWYWKQTDQKILFNSLFHRSLNRKVTAIGNRSFSTAVPEKNDRDFQKRASDFADVSARGIGQVIFLNSQTSGLAILGGLALGDPYLATMATIGTITATGTAKLAGIDSTSINDGLLGYNGCLVGCAAAVFGPASIMACTTTTLVGSAATPFVASALKESMGNMPQWTFAFNIVTLTNLLRTRPFLPPPPSGETETFVLEELMSKDFEALVMARESTTVPSPSVGDLMMSPLKGISQIFVVESSLSGAVIVGGIASYSPMLAAHAVVGSAIGTLMGLVTGAEMTELTMGLYGFNSALTSMGVGVFFVHSTPTMLLSAGGAALTASLFGAMKTVFGAYGAPALTLPFCFTMSACYLLPKQIPALVLAKSPHSPEKNQA